MKTKIQFLSVILVFCFINMNAQIKKSYSNKLPSTTTKKTYSNTNLKNTNYTNYNSQIKNNAKLIPTSYSPLVFSSRNLPKEAYAKLESVKSKGISSFSFASNGGWAIVTKNGEVYPYKITSSLSSKINYLKQYNRKIKQIVFQPKKSDSWVIVTENSVYSNSIPKELNTTLQSFIRKGKKIQSVSFGIKTSKTWVVVNTDGSFYANNIPDECYLALKKQMNNSEPRVKNVALLPNGEWIVLTDGGLLFVSRNLRSNSKEIYDQVTGNIKKDYQTEIIGITPDGKNWSVVANSKLRNQRSTKITSGMSRQSSELKKNTYTSGEGIKDVRKWVLRITLEYFYNDKSNDSDKKDDYVFNQWVVYTNGQNRMINKSRIVLKVNKSNSINKERRTYDGRNIIGNNIIFKGDNQNQFWVKEGENNRKKIGNYIEFEITEKLLSESSSNFIIHSSLIERTDSQLKGERNMSNNGEHKMIIKPLITELVNLEKVKPREWRRYKNANIRLRKYNNESDDMYGYIKFRNGNETREAKAMMRFELIE